MLLHAIANSEQSIDPFIAIAGGIQDFATNGSLTCLALARSTGKGLITPAPKINSRRAIPELDDVAQLWALAVRGVIPFTTVREAAVRAMHYVFIPPPPPQGNQTHPVNGLDAPQSQ
jgi:hypothetical protein